MVLNQETHHKKKTFKVENYELLEKFAVPFEEQFLFSKRLKKRPYFEER